MPKAKVTLFKPSGKFYTDEEWEIPTPEEIVERGGDRGDQFAPNAAMRYSKDFRRISGGAVLIESQEPWGYPGLIP